MMKPGNSKKIRALTGALLLAAATLTVVCGKAKHYSPAEPCTAGQPDTRWYANAIAENPNTAAFTISTANELAGLAQIVNGTWGGEPARDNFAGKTITLTAVADLSKYGNWTPIGDYAAGDDNKFAGTFDGGGYVVSNVSIKRAGGSFQGLFGLVADGKIQNLRLDSVNISGRDYVGGIAGYLENSTVANCRSTGTVSGREATGGVAGIATAKSSVTGSRSAGRVNGREATGGVAGAVTDGGSVTESYSTAEVKGTGQNTGGVAGVAENGSVDKSYSTGTVSGTENTGGVAGLVTGKGSVTNSYSTGAISGTGKNTGGVAGAADNSRITHSYSTGEVSGTECVGGIAGAAERNGNIAHSYSGGKVSGTESVGGIAGYVGSSRVSNCYFAGTVNGEENIGSVAGSIMGGGLTNSAALNFEVKGANTNTGRIAGFILGGVTLANNAAFAEMKNSAGNTAWRNKGASLGDGADISAAEINADGSIGERFTEEGGWTIENGRLPGFRQ